MPPIGVARWFHVTLHTYGTWLYGDPRGYRTRHHREHVEGDYRNPPPAGAHAAEYERSKRLLKQTPVQLSNSWRAVLGPALRDALLERSVEVIALALSSTHGHLQIRLPRREVREAIGLAKKHAWFVARDHGWTTRLWGKRCHYEPIRSRDHQVRAFHYICRHAEEGAWVWTFREGWSPAVEPG